MARDSWIWDSLGIAETAEVVDIRRAYARRLKAIDTEADPGAFIHLRAARDAAFAIAAGHLAPADAIAPLSWSPAHGQPDHDSEPSDSLPEPEIPLSAEPPPLPPPEPIPESPEADEAPPAEPGPRPRMIVAESALPELDRDDLERLDALLTSEETPPWAEIDSVTRRILASPAAERIDIAHWLEGWAADRIARFTPRSDPMIEAAVEHFRWDSEHPDLNRPPVIDWILQRRTDRQFELALQETTGRYDRLIRELRRARPAPPGPLAAWWRGVRVEFLLAYLQTLNPTILAGLDQDMLAWWEGHIAAQAEAKGLGRKLRDWRRRRIFDQGILGAKPVDWPLMIGILVMPYVFAWFLLQRGYGMGARLVAFGWLGLLVLTVLVAPAPPEPTYQGRSIEPHYLDMETDVAPIVAWATEANVTLARIAGTEPGLFRILSDRWFEAAGAREDGARFRESISEILRKTYCEGQGSDEAARICAGIMARKAAGDSPATVYEEPGAGADAALYRGPLVTPAYKDMAEDVDPILLWMTGGEVAVKDLRENEGALAGKLRSAWVSARGRGLSGDPFAEEMAATIADHVEAGLRAAPYKPLAQYWRLRADMAIYARSRSDSECESLLRGARAAPSLFPEEIEARARAFTAEAVLRNPIGDFGTFDGGRQGKSLSVPPAIAAAAARYANLDRDALTMAMVGRGTPAQRCDARVGLVEALLLAPRDQAFPVMRQLLSGY